MAAQSALAQDVPLIEVDLPQPGEQVTTDDIAVQVNVSNFTVDCAQAGRPTRTAPATSSS